MTCDPRCRISGSGTQWSTLAKFWHTEGRQANNFYSDIAAMWMVHQEIFSLVVAVCSGKTLQFNRLSPSLGCLGCSIPYLRASSSLVCSSPIQLSANALRGITEDGPSIWISVTPVGNWHGVPSLWLLLGPAKTRSQSLSVSPCPAPFK